MTDKTEPALERVARAICRANASCRPQRLSPDAIETQVEHAWVLWTDEAKAAIAAIDSSEVERLREALVHTAASLCAVISLLHRGGKKAAASDRMFDQMIKDYEASLERARQALKGTPA